VKFQQGEADGVSTDDTILAGLVAQDPYAQVVGDAFSSEPYGIGLPPDSPELTRIAGMLTTITFEDLGDGTTEVVTRQTGVPPAYRAPEARAGWETSLDRAADYLRRLASGELDASERSM
jgi:hypothetical protein